MFISKEIHAFNNGTHFGFFFPDSCQKKKMMFLRITEGAIEREEKTECEKKDC
jgi:hypothetical protein